MNKKQLRKVTLGLVGSLVIGSSVFAADAGKVTANRLNVRTGPGLDYDIVSQLSRGQEVNVINTYDKWLKISMENTQEVYVHADYINVISNNEEMEEVAVRKEGIVNVNFLNLRNDPSLDGEIIGQVNEGQEVGVLKEVDEWYYVETNSKKGYLYSDFVDVKTNQNKVESIQETVEEKVAVIDVSVLNVRQEPNLESNIIDKTYRNNHLEIVQVLDEWVEITTSNGAKGYLFKEYITIREKVDIEATEDIRQEIIDYAKQFLGNPYVYGGNSLTNGVDCSGFTQQIFNRFGYNLSRTSRTQINDGVRISRSELLPGDLVFYGYNGSISHVAIYAGNGQIIHANNRRTGIIMGNIDYGMPYIGASRIIQ